MDDEKKEDGDNSVATSAVTFVETEHGRLRRKQRGIDKKDLQAAKKHGKRELSYLNRSTYTYNGIVYVVDNATGEEVTSFTVPLELENVPISDEMQNEHDHAESKIRSDMSAWLSNTVLVVDTSGSMRESDVWGARSRLHSAWIAVALDFLAHRLETGASCPLDVMSIVALNENADVVIFEQPSTWVLYNRLLTIYRTNCFPARGHGPYLPSIETAEALLTKNPSASCALVLGILSDGKPSDLALSRGITKEAWNEALVERTGALARQFGRRLTLMCVGIGNMDDFDQLQDMVEAARDYGAIAHFKLPTMTSAAIGDVFTSLATSLTTTQTEMTDVRTSRQHRVRQLSRESRKKAAQLLTQVPPDDFWIYHLGQVQRFVYEETLDGRKRKGSFQLAGFQHPETRFFAFGKGPFGEGAERFAYRFFELASNGRTIVGRPLVAKESRFIVEKCGDDERERKKFVRTFCKTQQLARRLAEEFNDKLAEIPRVDDATPRVQFLDCSIYEIDCPALGKVSVLVEERLDERKWHKWNMNNGFVEGMKSAPQFDSERIRNAFAQLATEDLGGIEDDSDEDGEDKETVQFDSTQIESAFTSLATAELAVIEEGSEEQEESRGDYENGDSRVGSCRPSPVVFSPSDVAQAFSHFSYWASGRKRLVCDLQGVYDETENRLIFSDPVIHYYNPRDESRRCVHGRTDRGRKGVAMFFDTHKEHCSDLCKLVMKGFKDAGHRRPRRNRQGRFERQSYNRSRNQRAEHFLDGS